MFGNLLWQNSFFVFLLQWTSCWWNFRYHLRYLSATEKVKATFVCYFIITPVLSVEKLTSQFKIKHKATCRFIGMTLSINQALPRPIHRRYFNMGAVTWTAYHSPWQWCNTAVWTNINWNVNTIKMVHGVYFVIMLSCFTIFSYDFAVNISLPELQ